MTKTLSSLNILYAEDDIEIQNTIGKSLKLMCNNLYLAKDGLEALEIFHKQTVHIIIIDYVMPCLDGYGLSKEIRKTDKTIPIIISSGYSDKEKLLNAIELNLIKYIEKPLNYEKLSSALSLAIKSLEENNRLQTIINEELTYNYIDKIIIKNNDIIQLTKQEISLLELLLSRRNSLFMKESVEDIVFGEPVEANTMRNLVYRLRKKLGSDIILTVKDLGYIIK
jgi:DNA-binding response OmpR family regulator